MASIEDRLTRLEGLANAFQGLPAIATVSLPHNDSWLFEDNVDATHPANLRYIIASTTQKIVSARLSIYLAPYRTYNNFSSGTTDVDATAESGHSHSHAHTSAAHVHTLPIVLGAVGGGNAIGWNGAGANVLGQFATSTAPVDSTTPGNTGGDATGSSGHNHSHTHSVTGSSFLGVTEGTNATGVTISFDGVDQTVALGGPFVANQVELNVRPYLGTTQKTWHTIAMTPSGLGRIEAHLRLGLYVSAGQLV